MRYRKLGRWGVKVSTVALGSWLTYGGSVAEDAAVKCIQRAYELGINLFDTANVYMRGGAEEILGRAVQELPRSNYLLATKVFFPMGDGPNDRGLSRKHVSEQLHGSLQRLGVDYVDLYQCHRYDPQTPLEETCRVMDDLIRQGKVLYWGTSEWSADQISHAVSLCRRFGMAEPVSNQPQYSLLDRAPEQLVLPTCEDLGIGNVVWTPLAMGILTGKYKSVSDVPIGSRASGSDAEFMDEHFNQKTLDAVARLVSVAQEAGCSLAQLALAWCLRQPSVSSVIVGATSPEQVSENAAAADLDIDAGLLERATEILEPVAER